MTFATLTNLDAQTAAGPTRRVPVLICGGGISGLSLATWLRVEGIAATVLDKNRTPGGAIGSLEQDGFTFERGPSTVLDKYPSFDRLVELAGLEEKALRVPLATQTRYVWLRDRLHAVPTGLGAFLRTPLLPARAKLALLREPFVARGPAEESVATFVERRLGAAWVRNLITPMVSGIWAGDPAQLSIGHAFPIMKELERDGGLLRGGVARMRRRMKAKRTGQGAPLTKARKNLVSFTGGLQRLPEALAARLGEAYHAGIEILEIAPQNPGFIVTTRDKATLAITRWETPHVVIAAEVDHAAQWVAGFDAALAATLNSFPYNKLAVLSVGLQSGDACLPPGFGFLVPRGEELRILGAIIHSNFLPGRAPAGCAALSVFVGGELDRAGFELDDDALLAVAKRDLQRAVGWNGSARTLHLERWARAIPQYDMRHGERLAAIAAAETRWPGLHLAGNWRGGVAIGDRVEVMRALAQVLKVTVESHPS